MSTSAGLALTVTARTFDELVETLKALKVAFDRQGGRTEIVAGNYFREADTGYHGVELTTCRCRTH